MVTENIYIIFDPEGTGLIGFDQLLLAFSMSMKGTGGKNYRNNFLYHYCIGSQPCSAIYFLQNLWDTHLHNITKLKGVFAKNERGYKLNLTSICCVYKEKIVKND